MDKRTEIDVEVAAVAYAIGKVIADKTIAADPGLKRLDALGRLSAAHTMALEMAPMLQDEARAAIAAYRKVRAVEIAEAD